MRKFVTTAITSIFLASCGGEQPSSPAPATSAPIPPPEPKITAIVNVPSIAGQEEKQVATALGEPTSCENTKHGKKCFYQPGDTEVVFISGKADWITVNALDGVPYSEEALPLFGLDKSSASFSNDFVMRWSGVPGLLEVSIFRAQDHVDYAYIKTKTP
ncbi:hypothetical protein [Limnobacter sp. 130]|uniref:hypothetical protein n=1 Tax=Limnobacter sp. 130 TaxID=2653147 RepID=UPI00135C2396|nr:hypothetical protein [Limnobacter sp. 130]